ncbi:hypothetical protein [Sphingomonas sp. OK281]|uniref:hypothetical protein n=1 Tax=Sphingomonas sp. OK281 TaxID=1881067 RepID=UPI000B877FE7|nr:hypothetical protein [Sphingomonas sp. OK281]
MIGDQARGEAAQCILDVRSLRKVMFPSELFDEFAWNMMLHLFVGLANNQVMTEIALIEKAGASEHSGRRWIEHLVKDGQVAERRDHDDVVLTADAIARLRTFLDDVLNRGDAILRG